MEKIQDISSIRKGDYLKVLSNQPAYHLCTCYGSMDIRKEDVKPEELTCIVNSVIDEKTCYVTTLLPREGSNFIADIAEIIGLVDPESLPEKARNLKHSDWLTPPRYIYTPAESDGTDLETLAKRAIKVTFPDKEISCTSVLEQGYFSMERLLERITFALSLVDKESEKYPELKEEREALAEWVGKQRFKRYDEVIAGIDNYNWLIAIDRDRSEVVICPDIKERTKFSRSLGPEYVEAARAVDYFVNKCFEVMMGDEQ